MIGGRFMATAPVRVPCAGAACSPGWCTKIMPPRDANSVQIIHGLVPDQLFGEGGVQKSRSQMQTWPNLSPRVYSRENTSGWIGLLPRQDRPSVPRGRGLST
eukprot:5118374-Pyramimonas_sp.AAC.1